MKDAYDTSTPDLLGEEKRPRRGRPTKHGHSMPPDQRKRIQRANQWYNINNNHSSTWTDAECLLVLSSIKYPHGSPMDRAAWRQLGTLRGFC